MGQRAASRMPYAVCRMRRGRAPGRSSRDRSDSLLHINEYQMSWGVPAICLAPIRSDISLHLWPKLWNCGSACGSRTREAVEASERMRNQRPDIILGPQQQQQQQHEQSRVQLSVGWNNFVLVSDRTWSLGRAVDQEKEGEGGAEKSGSGRGGEPWRGSLILILLLLLTLAFCSKFFLFLFFLSFFFGCARAHAQVGRIEGHASHAPVSVVINGTTGRAQMMIILLLLPASPRRDSDSDSSYDWRRRRRWSQIWRWVKGKRERGEGKGAAGWFGLKWNWRCTIFSWVVMHRQRRTNHMAPICVSRHGIESNWSQDEGESSWAKLSWAEKRTLLKAAAHI